MWYSHSNRISELILYIFKSTYLTARHVGGETHVVSHLSFVQVIFMLNVQSISSIITFYVRNVEIFFTSD